MGDLFCRHNRFTADCPICSRGTVLERSGSAPARGGAGTRGARSPGRRTPAEGQARGVGSRGTREFAGPYVSAGPYEDEAGERYEVRLERVPGGIRLGEWAGGGLRRRAPRLAPGGVRALIAAARERAVLPVRDLDRLEAALGKSAERGSAGGSEVAAITGPQTELLGASPGRSGDMRDELRVERLFGTGEVRVGRWVMRPGTGWVLQEAPTMLPATRYAEALGSGTP